MRRLDKFRRLSPDDQHLIIAAAALLGAVRAGLYLLPFRTVRRLLSRISAIAAARAGGQGAAADRVTWAVTVASRYIPRATCLTQALVAQTLLQGCRRPAELRIGVARGAAGQFLAHAWVECEGRAVIGDSGLDSYRPLPSLGGSRM